MEPIVYSAQVKMSDVLFRMIWNKKVLYHHCF